MATTLDRLRAALAGRYEIEKEIGAGGMATVFLGHDLKHDRDVAIKVLHPDLGAALGGERFLSEIKTTAKLQHPHILPLLDSGEADSLLYYVMPFVVGESLRQRIDRERQLPINEAIRFAKEVASALDYAHRQGVIHRDIKPENILIHDKQALVADFGIALAVTAAGGGRLTQTGLSLGTPQYMSPEQAMGERTIDARSDIYSLAAVTYEMITGDPPFAGSSVQAIVAKIMTEKPTAMSLLRETVPLSVEDAVTVGLSKLPADRFATADEFSKALSDNTGSFARSTTIQRSGPGRRRVDLVAQRAFLPVVAIALVASALALWGWLRPGPPKQVIRNEISLDSTQALTGGWSRIALSPDGSTLVFTGGPDSKLYLRRRDELSATPLPGTEGAVAPFFSPDGNQVGFTTASYVLRVVSTRGGPPITLNDSIVGRAGSSWGTDGFIYLPTKDNNRIIRLAPAPGAPAVSVTVLDTVGGEVAHRLPDVLPNGKGAIFTIYYGGKGKSGTAIAVVDFATHKHTVLVSALGGRYSPSGHLLYVTENGTLMAAPFDQNKMRLTGEPVAIAQDLRVGTIGATDLAVSRNGTLVYVGGGAISNLRPVWVSRDGKEKVVDSVWRGFIGSPSLSPDGNRVAFTKFDGIRSDIWVKQLDRGPELKLTFSNRNNEYPAWTPDGKSVTYFGGGNELMTKRADGSAQEVVQLHGPRLMAESRWSHDGKWLVFRTNTSGIGVGDIFAIRPGVDTAPIPIATSPSALELAPTLSPDDRFLAYSSNETGRTDIYVVPFPNTQAAKWTVSATGGLEPLWSHSGKELFFRDVAGNMMTAEVSTSPTFSVRLTKMLFRGTRFSTSSSHTSYDVSTDDKRFLMIGPVGTNAIDRIIVVDNWFDELRSKFKK
ncbi:MAG: protein kinase [Gemmatimonadota bacterium]|nr:protein kinase [Gemmatimonadota bacterium]